MSDEIGQLRVVVAEDRVGMRNLVKMLVDDEIDLTVVGEADNGDDALAVTTQLRPDVLVLDLGLPGMDGEVVLERLATVAPDVRVVVLSGQASAIIAPRLMAAGAREIVEKGGHNWEGQLLQALRGVG